MLEFLKNATQVFKLNRFAGDLGLTAAQAKQLERVKAAMERVTFSQAALAQHSGGQATALLIVAR